MRNVLVRSRRDFLGRHPGQWPAACPPRSQTVNAPLANATIAPTSVNVSNMAFVAVDVGGWNDAAGEKFLRYFGDPSAIATSQARSSSAISTANPSDGRPLRRARPGTRNK